MAKELEEDDGTKHALDLKTKIESAILRFEDGEKVRPPVRSPCSHLTPTPETPETRVPRHA